MKFYSDTECNYYVWDDKNKRAIPLRTMKQSEEDPTVWHVADGYETDDPHEIELLTKVGLRSEGGGWQTKEGDAEGPKAERKPGRPKKIEGEA